MSKYRNTQNQAKRSKSHSFLFGLLIYALVFLVVAGIGLLLLWNYIDAYEQSRPRLAIDAYMDALTVEHVCDLSQDVLDQVDKNIQTEEEVRTYISEQLDGINYARKSKECTDTRQVFVLRVGTTVIGQFSIVAEKPDRYGFTPWSLEAESFDISALNLFETDYEIVIPCDHKVTVNGYELDDSYLVDEKIIYEEIEAYYKDYDLPYRVKYLVGPYAGEIDIVIKDPAGNEVMIDENTDWSQYFNIGDEKEITKLDSFVKDYVKRYVAFTGSTRENCEKYYEDLIKYVVKGSDFEFRLTDAIIGLKWGQSQGDTIVSLVTNHRVRLEEERFMCDFTYEVDTKGREGVVRTTTNARVIIVETDNGLKVESMSVY